MINTFLGTAICGKRLFGFMSYRHGGLASKSKRRGGEPMNDYEVLDIIISVIGLVISAIAIGITIANKNNRH